jgi:predicted RNA-binding Zn ribbon-like protein
MARPDVREVDGMPDQVTPPVATLSSSFGGITFSRLGDPLCIEFVNRTNLRLKPPREPFVGTYEALIAWAEAAGMLSRGDRRELVELGDRDPRRATMILRRALNLREGLFALFSGGPASRKGLETLNAEIRRASAHLHVARERGSFALTWKAGSRILGPVVLSAVELLTSSDLKRIQVCDGDGCEFLFLDNSRTRRRRWCSMAVCGNRAKARRHRIRSSAHGVVI